MVGISGQFRTILTIFDPPLPFPYSIPSPVVSVVAMALIETLAHFTLRFPPRFTNPPSHSIPLYAFGSHPIPSAFTYDFRGFGTPLPPSYSIPSPVISVVTMAVTEVPGTHFTLRSPPSIYGSLFRFTVPFSPLSDFRTSPYLLQDQ
jgi:hypothetical protein